MKEEERQSIKEEEYIYIVLRQHLCRVSLTKLLHEEKEPPIETLLCFPNEDLPVGMGAFALDSNLFLIGGEILNQGARLDTCFDTSDDSILKSLSDGMYIYDHQHPNHLKKVSTMLAPKPSPQVAFLDGKLYVFAGTRCCGMQAAPEPRFESYDPKKNDWEFLPSPPFYSSEAPSDLYVSVIGRRIFVTNPRGVSTYDVDNRTWTLSRDVEGTPFEFSGRVVAESDDGTIVGYTRRGVVVYSDDSLGRAQVLKDLNSRLPVPHFNMQAAFLGYLGENIYYLLLSEMFGRVTGDWDMHIVLFRLEMLPQEEEARTHEVEGEGESDFCCVTVLRHHVYNARKDITKEVFNPTHAFTMWSSADYAVLDAKPLSLSAKRNRKKKEKQLRVFPEALLIQLLKVMLNQDVEIRLGGHQIFSVLLIPSSNHPRHDASNNTRRWPSNTACAFASITALLKKLRREKDGTEVGKTNDDVFKFII